LKKTFKNIIIIIFSILVIIFTALTAASFYFYDIAVKRSPKEFLQNSKDLKDNIRLAENLVKAKRKKKKELYGSDWVKSKKYETWTLTSKDGLNLVAYYIPAKKPTANTAILIHGYTAGGKDMGTYAKIYYEKLKYNVLMPDARGHGSSEGNYIGFGWAERTDYLLWIEKIIDALGPDAKITLHGVSMGGAAVMMLSGEKLPKQVKTIVEDCGYTSVYDELSYQLRKMYHLPGFPVLTATSILTDIRAGYNFYEASALNQVRKDKVPMLFIHGGSDTFVPTDMVYQLYDACQVKKDILIVNGAGHGLAYAFDKEAYESKIIEFDKCYLK
jgi:fermentation-respiration switch protein FrsA (DUF1100 family)